MALEMLISAVNAQPEALLDEMRVTTPAVLVNQCGKDDTSELIRNGKKIRVYSSAKTGVGASRNCCIAHAQGELLLFADEDIIYDDGYAQLAEREFAAHPEAEMLLFNVEAMPGRQTYHNDRFFKIHRFNCGRFPAYSIAVRRDSLRRSRVTFSELFGGGARYSNGEDSLFLMDCVKRGMKIYATPVQLGHEKTRESTWFHGYTDRFFFDRGVLYPFLYGHFSTLAALRFLVKNRRTMCREKPFGTCFALMQKGIKRGWKEKRIAPAHA